MLKNTFIHIPGIGQHTEYLLWKSKIFSWDDFIANHHTVPISSSKKEIIAFHVKKSLKAYEEEDYKFFAENIPINFHWRAYHELKDKCCFLDIETTGLDKYSTEITLIGLYDGKESSFFINIKDIDGFEAVRLWHRYERGDRGALELLIRYNQADIENQKVLMDFTFDKLKEKEFLSVK